MDYINKIELKGRVGTVRSNVVNESRVANFSLITDFLYKTRDGNAVSESTWFNVVAWEGRDIIGLEKIGKGSTVHVSGRMRSNRFEGADGSEKHYYEVLATKLRIVDEAEGTNP